MNMMTGGFPQCPPSTWPPPGCPPWYPSIGGPPWYPGANGAISFSSSAPPNPIRGHLWWNGTIMQMWDGAAWVNIGGGGSGTPGAEGVFVGPNPPTGPVPGQLWLNSTTDTLFVWDGSNWLPSMPTGVTVAATAPSNPTVGDFWFNTGNDFLYIYDGSGWVLSSVDALTITASSAPTPAVAGMLWHNTTDGRLYVYDGASWILATPVGTTSGPNPPANPTPGTLWWNTTAGEMEVWDGNAWVVTGMTNPPPVGSINYVGPSAPANPVVGELWYNTTNNQITIWDGTAWVTASGIVGPQGPPGPPGPAGSVGGTINGNLTINGTLTTAVGSVAAWAQINPGCWAPSAAPLAICGWANAPALLCGTPGTGGYDRVAQFDIRGNGVSYLEMTINASDPNGGSLMGAINVIPGFLGVAYASVSDVRLKDDLEPISDSGAIIDALKPVSYHWKAARDLPKSHGFAAQDLHRAFPEAVHRGNGTIGQKDFTPWMSDNSKLVPVLTAEIKELRKRVALLEGKCRRLR